MSERKKRKPRLMAWLVFAIMVAALISTTTLSRYMTQISGSGTATVAAVDLSGSTVTFNTDALKPGGSATYQFNVVNFTSGAGGRVSDVTQNYTITVTDTGNLPLTYTLHCTSTGGSGTGISPVTAAQLTKGDVLAGGMLPHSVQTTHSYTLAVSWPAGSNDPALADEIDLITITVNAQQAV